MTQKTIEDVVDEKDQQLLAFLERQGYRNLRKLPDGTIIGLSPLIFTVGLCIGLNEHSWERRYCYPSTVLAIEACNQLQDGDSEPLPGWVAQRPEHR